MTARSPPGSARFAGSVGTDVPGLGDETATWPITFSVRRHGPSPSLARGFQEEGMMLCKYAGRSRCGGHPDRHGGGARMGGGSRLLSHCRIRDHLHAGPAGVLQHRFGSPTVVLRSGVRTPLKHRVRPHGIHVGARAVRDRPWCGADRGGHPIRAGLRLERAVARCRGRRGRDRRGLDLRQHGQPADAELRHGDRHRPRDGDSVRTWTGERHRVRSGRSRERPRQRGSLL